MGAVLLAMLLALGMVAGAVFTVDWLLRSRDERRMATELAAWPEIDFTATADAEGGSSA